VALLAASAAALGALAAWMWAPVAVPALPTGPPLQVGQLETRERLPEFMLEALPRPVTQDSLRGHWTFIYFGYTSCPDACPATLALLAQVRTALQARGGAAPRILFISIDPARDTAAVLQRYAAAFGAGVEAATADPERLRPLLAFFGASFERHDGPPGASPPGAIFDHTSNVFLVTPEARWLATFPPLAEAAPLLADTALLTGAAAR